MLLDRDKTFLPILFHERRVVLREGTWESAVTKDPECEHLKTCQALESKGVGGTSLVTLVIRNELDVQLREHAERAGVTEFRRSRCLDVDPMVGPVLADIVEEYL